MNTKYARDAKVGDTYITSRGRGWKIVQIMPASDGALRFTIQRNRNARTEQDIFFLHPGSVLA